MESHPIYLKTSLSEQNWIITLGNLLYTYVDTLVELFKALAPSYRSGMSQKVELISDHKSLISANPNYTVTVQNEWVFQIRFSPTSRGAKRISNRLRN
jgi:hypothetical protein